MQITELILTTQQLQAQQQFYTTILGLPVLTTTAEAFTVQAGSTRLTWQKTSQETLYHMAFAIPSNQAVEAKAWLLERVPLLKQDDQDEFSSESWHATSFYFRDAAGHILELIAHHELPNARSGPFSSHDLLYVSEIGMAFADVTKQVKNWQTTLGFAPYRNSISEMFAAVGDIYGLFITVQNGRNWFPTSTDAAIISPVEVTIQGVAESSLDLAPYPYKIKVR